MSSFLRGEIFDWVIGSVSLSNNILTNWVIGVILTTILSVITYRMVGDLYSSGDIGGSIAGKIFYLVLFIINVFITAIILRAIKFIIQIFIFITTLSAVTWWVITGFSFIISAMFLYVKIRKTIK